MNTSPNPDTRRPLRTSDLAAASTASTQRDESPEPAEESSDSPAVGALESAPGAQAEKLEALFTPDAAARYRKRWAEVQAGFVDDPQRAVAEGDELVAEVMQSLAESFAVERHRLEEELTHTGQAPTEALRVGLRRYRSFFERLLSL